MQLDQYLRENNLRPADFARQIGVAHVSLNRYRAGTRRPRWSILKRISDATGGKVTANDFAEDWQGEALEDFARNDVPSLVGKG